MTLSWSTQHTPEFHVPISVCIYIYHIIYIYIHHLTTHICHPSIYISPPSYLFLPPYVNQYLHQSIHSYIYQRNNVPRLLTTFLHPTAVCQPLPVICLYLYAIYSPSMSTRSLEIDLEPLWIRTVQIMSLRGNTLCPRWPRIRTLAKAVNVIVLTLFLYCHDNQAANSCLYHIQPDLAVRKHNASNGRSYQ